MIHTALVTGANRGIGLEFVKQYADSGWQVLACCRSPESAPELMNMAAECQGRLHVIPLDVSSQESITRLAAQLKGEKIDVFINNAGVYSSSGILGSSAIDVEAWQHSFAVNSIAPIKLVEALQDNISLGSKKSIALITSKMGSVADNGSGGSYLYRSSKAALNAVGKSLAIDLANRQIKVGIYHPGWVLTDMGGSNALISAEQSVSGMRRQIDSLSPETSGQFVSYDGQSIPW